MSRQKTEVSCGGLVLRGTPPEILIVRVKNLKGDEVWTFPKGHIEKGETETETALREVLEETGWECAVAKNNPKPFKRVQYFFKKNEETIRKQVVWFLMEPLKKTGSSDPNEILDSRWASFAETEKLVQYPSDKMLLKELQARSE